MKQIRGAGGGGKGGGGSQRAPVESPDSLRSRQFARVLDATSEGEVVGLVNGLKSVYLDDTPVENADGSLNFQGVVLVERTGTQNQSYVPGFGAVESETAVSVEVTAALPVVRSVGNPNANAVRVTISIPQLTLQNTSNGDITGTSVQIAIDLQNNGGGFVEQLQDTISGKTTSRYQRAYRVELPGSGPWDIRVRRVTPDSTTANLQNATYWASYTELIDVKLRYPNTALCALSVDAERFQTIPRRGYEMKGLKVRIPSNYDPIARTYAGAWDGTFTTDWTNNPAWCFYDMLTAKRYGLGEFVDVSQVDKWALYRIAQYCDELVPNGFGGTEPRFTCNLYIQSREDAYSLISNMASIFCGVTYWAGGSIVATQDAPPLGIAKLYTPANVIQTDSGGFNYSGSSAKTRHTVALVTWNDPADRYRQKIEYVEDPDGIARLGVVQTEVVAMGCTSRGQAHRFGRRLLYSERMETEVVSFRTGLDGLDIAPGDVIQTSDPVRAGVRMGGRVVSASTSEVTLDAAVEIDGLKSYTLWVTLPDGTVQSRAAYPSAGEAAVVPVSPAFDDAPQAGAVWVLAASDLVPETWRVISISEAEKGTQAEVTALAYRADKYDAVERDMILAPLQTSSLNTGANTPTNLRVTEALYLVNPAVVGARVTVSWTGSAFYYELQYRRRGNNWQVLTTQNPSVDIQPVDPGIYDFAVVAVNAIGVRSNAALATYEVRGKYAVPEDVEGLTVTKVSGVALAAWLQHPALDVIVGGEIVIRHTPEIEMANWNDSYVLDQFPGANVSGLVPLMTGTYFAKARDSSGNWSVTEARFVATEGMVTGFTTVGTTVQAPGFPGAKTGLVAQGGMLSLGSAALIDSMLTDIDLWPTIDAIGGVIPSGSYDFDAPLDLGTVATRRFEVDLAALSFDTGDYIDSRESNIDDWDSFDGSVINDCDVTVLASTTNEDPLTATDWTEEAPFFVSDFTCRAARFRAVLESGNPTHNIAVSRLTVRAKVPA